MSAGVGDGNPVFLDRAVGADQCCGTDRSFRYFALGVLARSPSAVGLHSLFLLVGEQNKGQVKLADELIVRIDAIRADTDNHGIGFGYSIDSVAEPARFLGSARCVVFRIKPQNNVFAGVLSQRMLFAVAPRESERRRFLPFESCHEAPP